MGRRRSGGCSGDRLQERRSGRREGERGKQGNGKRRDFRFRRFWRRHQTLCLALSAAAAVFGLWFVWHSIGLYRERKAVEAQISLRREREPEPASTGSGNPILEWNGKKYRRNTAVRAILCLGVDTTGEMERYQVSGAAGQADAIFLAAQDMATDTVRFLIIPRDTMTEITLFDYFGNELGKDIQHLTLSFAYGDGREKSCELTAEAVSNLLFGLSIDGYFTANIGTVRILNDAIGGVEVTIDDSSLAAQNPEFRLGETIVLKGQAAEDYIRYRDIDQYQTALTRLERQKGYLKSYIETAKKRYQEDDQLIVRLVDDIERYTVTNLAKDQYMDMGLAVLNSPQVMEDGDFITVPGEVRETELYEEFYPDEEKLREIVIELFYKEMPVG